MTDIDKSHKTDAAAHRLAAEILTEAAGCRTDHPTVDELVAYQEGALADPAGTRVQEHLRLCESCSEDLRQLERVGEPTEALAAELGPESLEEDWLALQARLGSEPSLPMAEDPKRPERVATAGARKTDDGVLHSNDSSRWWLAAAALVVLAISGWWVALSGSWRPEVPASGLEGFESPFLAELRPEGQEVLRSPGFQLLEPQTSADLLVLRLISDSLDPTKEYSVVLAAADGEVLWGPRAAQRQPQGTFLILIPFHQLERDTPYRLELRQGTEPEAPSLAVYPFTVLSSP